MQPINLWGPFAPDCTARNRDHRTPPKLVFRSPFVKKGSGGFAQNLFEVGKPIHVH